MEAAAEIKSRLDVVDTVQEYLPLKPAGSGSFRGLCPFHHEKTPSFFVNRPRQTWHCFGCDAGGDLISFVMKMEGMEFRETLELLAQKVGITLPAFKPEDTSEKKRLQEVNDLASRWFRSMLLNLPQAEEARKYAAERGIDDLTGDLWRIGYAPASWDALSNTLIQKGANADELIRAGLSSKNDRGGVYDRFRGRLMFTICDVHGNVVGFTGRLLNAEAKEAKYVNTPETRLYRKSAVLYGLDKAKGEIKRQDLAVIVEGNMDALTSHKAGVMNVIASSGTALTHDQLGLLKRFTLNLAIAFDQDAAGNAATVRGLDLARALDFNIRIVSLPAEAGKDPDEAIRKDPEIWRQAIRNSEGLIEWLYRNAFKAGAVEKPEGKKLIVQAILPELRRIANPIERDAWLSRLSQDLDVSIDALREALKKSDSSAPLDRGLKIEHLGRIPAAEPKKPSKSKRESLEERILAILQCKPELEPLAKSILKEYPFVQSPTVELSNYLAILADCEFEDQSLPTLEQELTFAARSLRGEYLAEQRSHLENEMREAELKGDAQLIQELLIKFSHLNN